MTLTQNIKEEAKKAGFVSIGISSPDMLRCLPHGWIGTGSFLRTCEEELPDVKLVILLGLYAWDRAFNLTVDSSYLKNNMMSKSTESPESH